MNSEQKRTAQPAGIWLLIACHLLIVVPLAWYLNIWSDEASSLHTTQYGIVETLHNAAFIERQAPLYFWILSLWRYLSGSVFFARVLSILFSILAIWLFGKLAGRLFRSRKALLATAFFALHPILIWASLEIRVYALVILITVLLLRLFFDGFFSAGTQRRSQIWFVLLSITALYTNYYLGFLLVGCFVGLLLTRKWRPARDYLACMAIAGVAFAPILLTLRSQFQINSTGFSEERSLVEGIRRIWTHVLTFLLPADIIAGEKASTVGLVRLWIVRVAIIVAGFFSVTRRKSITGRTIALAAISAVIVAFLLVAYFLLGSWFVAIRHASVLFVPLVLFCVSLIEDLFPSDERSVQGISRFAAPVLGIVVLAFFSYALIHLYPNGAKSGDWLRVGEFIEQNETAGEPIIIFHTYDAMSLPYQYHGVNQILPRDRFMEFDFASPFADSEHMRTRTDFTISQVPADAGQIWLITNDECRTPGICDQLENFVESNYNVVLDKEFYLQRVRLLRQKMRPVIAEPTESIEKPLVRCEECDREVDHYNTFLEPTGELRNVCWECLARQEKGFNAKRNFRRDSRGGVIPR